MLDKIDFIQKLNEITAALPGEWAAKIDEERTTSNFAELRSAEYKIFINNGAYHCKKRFYIHGHFPYLDGYGRVGPDNSHTITCAERRTGTAIAKDIASRFLPTYIEQYTKAAQQRDDMLARRARTNAMNRLAAHHMRGHTYHSHNNKHEIKGARVGYHDQPNCKAEFQPYSDTFDLNFTRITERQAIQLLDLFAEITNRTEEDAPAFMQLAIC